MAEPGKKGKYNATRKLRKAKKKPGGVTKLVEETLEAMRKKKGK